MPDVYVDYTVRIRVRQPEDAQDFAFGLIGDCVAEVPGHEVIEFETISSSVSEEPVGDEDDEEEDDD